MATGGETLLFPSRSPRSMVSRKRIFAKSTRNASEGECRFSPPVRWLLRTAKAEHALAGCREYAQWVWSVPQLGQGHGHLSTCRNQTLFLGNKDEGRGPFKGLLTSDLLA